MAPKTLNVVFAADSSQLGQAFGQIESKSASIGDKLASVGGALTKGLTLPIVGAGIASLKMAGDVDKGLREVNTLLGETGSAAEATFQELQSGVRGLSNEIGVAQDVLVGGLYSAISAGVPKENAFEFMKVAAKASIAGVTDTETAVDGLTTTLNAFGLDASRAQDVADSMFTAVKGGKTTFEELSASLFQVAPAAAAAGVEFTDVNAALAALTAAGTPTSVATTQVRAAIVELTKGGTLASKAFEQVSGKTFPEFIAQGGNLQEALFEIKKEADANGKSMLDMFGSVEAGQAALSLTGKASEKFASELENQAKAAGATDKAFNEMEKSGARKGEAAMTRLKNGLIDVGNVLLPIAAAIVDKIGKMATAFSSLSPAVQKVIIVIAGIAAAVGPVLFIVGKLITVFGTLVKAFQAVMLVMRLLQLLFIANPFGLLIAAIVALVAIVVMNWDTIKNAIGTAWDWISAKTAAAWEWIKGVLLAAWEAIKAVFMNATIVGLVIQHWDTIKAATAAVWNAITGFLSGLWEGIKAKASAIWGSITGALSSAWNTIQSLVSGAANTVRSVISNAWETVKTTTSNAWNSVKTAVTTAVGNVMSEVRSIPGKITSALGNLGSLLYGAGKDVVQGLINGVKSMGRTLVNAIVNLIPAPVRGVVKSALGIGSPSKVFKGFGQNIMEGLIIGLQEQSRNLGRQMGRITDQVKLGATDLAVPTIQAAVRPTGLMGAALAGAGGPSVVYNVSLNLAPSGLVIGDGLRQLADMTVEALEAYVRANGTRDLRFLNG